jgi:hypothetical protein
MQKPTRAEGAEQSISSHGFPWSSHGFPWTTAEKKKANAKLKSAPVHRMPTPRSAGRKEPVADPPGRAPP